MLALHCHSAAMHGRDVVFPHVVRLLKAAAAAAAGLIHTDGSRRRTSIDTSGMIFQTILQSIVQLDNLLARMMKILCSF